MPHEILLTKEERADFDLRRKHLKERKLQDKIDKINQQYGAWLSQFPDESQLKALITQHIESLENEEAKIVFKSYLSSRTEKELNAIVNMLSLGDSYSVKFSLEKGLVKEEEKSDSQSNPPHSLVLNSHESRYDYGKVDAISLYEDDENTPFVAKQDPKGPISPEKKKIKKFQEFITDMDSKKYATFNRWLNREEKRNVFNNWLKDQFAETPSELRAGLKKQKDFYAWFDKQNKELFAYYESRITAPAKRNDFKEWHEKTYAELMDQVEKQHKAGEFDVIKTDGQQKFLEAINSVSKQIHDKLTHVYQNDLERKESLQFHRANDYLTDDQLYNQFVDEKRWDWQTLAFNSDPQDEITDIALHVLNAKKIEKQETEETKTEPPISVTEKNPVESNLSGSSSPLNNALEQKVWVYTFTPMDNEGKKIEKENISVVYDGTNKDLKRKLWEQHGIRAFFGKEAQGTDTETSRNTIPTDRTSNPINNRKDGYTTVASEKKGQLPQRLTNKDFFYTFTPIDNDNNPIQEKKITVKYNGTALDLKEKLRKRGIEAKFPPQQNSVSEVKSWGNNTNLASQANEQSEDKDYLTNLIAVKPISLIMSDPENDRPYINGYRTIEILNPVQEIKSIESIQEITFEEKLNGINSVEEKKRCKLFNDGQSKFLAACLNENRVALDEYQSEHLIEHFGTLGIACGGYFGEIFYVWFAYIAATKSLAMALELFSLAIDPKNPIMFVLGALATAYVFAANVTYDPWADTEAQERLILLSKESMFNNLIAKRFREQPIPMTAFTIFAAGGVLPEIMPAQQLAEMMGAPDLVYPLSALLMLSGLGYYFFFNAGGVYKNTEKGWEAFIKTIYRLMDKDPETSSVAFVEGLHKVLSFIERGWRIAYGPFFITKLLGGSMLAASGAAGITFMATLIVALSNRVYSIEKHYYPEENGVITKEEYQEAERRYDELKGKSLLEKFRLLLDPSSFLTVGASLILPMLLSEVVNVTGPVQMGLMAATGIATSFYLITKFMPSSRKLAVNKEAHGTFEINTQTAIACMIDQAFRAFGMLFTTQAMLPALVDPTTSMGTMGIVGILSVELFLSFAAYLYQAEEASQAHKTIGTAVVQWWSEFSKSERGQYLCGCCGLSLEKILFCFKASEERANTHENGRVNSSTTTYEHSDDIESGKPTRMNGNDKSSPLSANASVNSNINNASISGWSSMFTFSKAKKEEGTQLSEKFLSSSTTDTPQENNKETSSWASWSNWLFGSDNKKKDKDIALTNTPKRDSMYTDQNQENQEVTYNPSNYKNV